MTALGASAALVFRVDVEADRLELLVSDGYPEGAVEAYRHVPLATPMPGTEAVRTGRPVYIESPEDFSSRYPLVAAAVTPTRSAAFAVVPLQVGGGVLGVLVLSYAVARAFSQRERAFIEALGNLGALALERARFHELEQLARRRASFLARAGHALASSLTNDEVLEAIAQMAVPELADWCSIDLFTHGGGVRQVAVAHVDPEKVTAAREIRRRYPPDLTAPHGLGRVLREGVPELYRHLSDEMLVAAAKDDEHLALLRQLAFRSALVVPVAARGRTFGAVTFVSSAERGYDESDLVFAEDLADRVGLAIDNAHLYRAARSLAELGRRAIAAPLDEVLQAATELVATELDTPLAEISVVSQGALVSRGAVGFSAPAAPRSLRTGHLLGHALARTEAVVVDDVALETRFALGDHLEAAGVQSAIVLAVPGQDAPLGVIAAFDRQPRCFAEAAAQQLQGVASIVAAAISGERAEADAVASRARLSGILESAMDAIVTVDETQRVLLFNQAAERMFGYAAAEVLGRSLSILLPERLRERHHDYLERFEATGGTRRAIGELGMLVARRKGGEEFPIEATISKLVHGGQIFFTVILRDVTERHEAEEQRAAYQRELEEASKHKDDFIAMLGHELRNPLAAISNAAQLLARAPDGASAERARGVVARQADHMARLIDDLLDVSRVMRGKIELRPEVLDLVEVVATVVSDHQPAAQRLGVDLGLVTDSPTWVKGDRARLVQIAANLVDNAIKFSRIGGRVDVTVKRDADTAALVVCDDGVGIVADQRRRIFEPFRQGDNSLSRAGGGLGLGLSLVRGLVELHRGTVEASSDGMGRGARFTVLLPLCHGPAEARPKNVEVSMALRRVVLIEDNLDAATMLAEVLSLVGCDVRVAHDGVSGVALCREFAPELVLCDVGLPGALSGYDVARELSGAEDRPRLVALTGYGRAEDRAKALESGFDEHLAKPVTFERLRAVIAELAPAASGAQPSSATLPRLS